MFSGFGGVMLVTLVSVIGQRTDAPNEPLTPAGIVEASKHSPLADVAVRFRVCHIGESNPDWTYLYADELPNRTLFAVKLSRETREALKHRGVSDIAKFFAGKEVEFAGRVERATLWCFAACDLYSMPIENLEQFRETQPLDRASGN
jgi:hypothetical protein